MLLSHSSSQTSVNYHSSDDVDGGGIIDLTLLQARQYKNLVDVIQLLHLHPGCVHSKLECLFTNPYVIPRTLPLPPCGNACFFCRRSYESKLLYKPFCRHGLTKILLQLFIKSPVPIAQLILGPPVVSTLALYSSPPPENKCFNQLVFKNSLKKSASNKKEIQVILLQLFASGILIPRVLEQKLYCLLTTDNNGNPNINNDSFWNGIEVTPRLIPE
jgi:hypothetical protein